MDTGNKTLAQLSEEGKEARYVSLDVGAKISGYTKEYLERLCRLHKVNFLERNIGEHVIELESLLKETHTILLSYEGITFVDKSALNAPSEVALASPTFDPQKPMTDEKRSEYVSQIPNFVQNGGDEPLAQEKMFSFTGRAVVSDAHHPEEKIAKEVLSKHTILAPRSTAPVPPLREEEKTVPRVMTSVIPEVAESPQKKIAAVEAEAPQVIHHAVHVPVAEEKVEASVDVPLPVAPGASTPSPTPNVLAAQQATVLSVRREAKPDMTAVQAEVAAPLADEWDALLFGGTESPAPKIEFVAAPRTTPSPYHPIVTSRDARDHHEDLPLFPLLAPKVNPLLEGPAIVSSQLTGTVTPPVQKAAALPEAPLVETPKQIPLTVGGNPLFGATNPNVGAPVIPHSPRPAMRVMPQFPAVEEEHHVIERSEHHLARSLSALPLTKSVGFNFAFAALLIASSFLLLSELGGPEPSKLGGSLSGQIAAVGEAVGNIAEDAGGAAPSLPTATSPKLEFSDEVVIAEGDTFGTMLVQPIFRDTAGSVVEYSITPVAE